MSFAGGDSTPMEEVDLAGFYKPGKVTSLLGDPAEKNAYRVGHLKEMGFDVSSYVDTEIKEDARRSKYAWTNPGYALTDACYNDVHKLIGEARNSYDIKTASERIALSFQNLHKDLVFNNCNLERIRRQGLRVLRDLKSRNNLLSNELEPVIARFTHKDYWAKVLNKSLIRGIDNAVRARGHVCKNKEPYISKVALNYFRIRQTNQKNQIDGMELVEVGNSDNRVDLADIIEKSLANGANRRAELMVRIHGMEELSDSKNWTANFYTMTAPSKYHPTSNSRRNKKYEGATVREAVDYLNTVWKRIRAEINRQTENEYYGVRVCEPHVDGTPHFHFLIFAAKDEAETITEIMAKYAIQENAGELEKKKSEVQKDPDGYLGLGAEYTQKSTQPRFDVKPLNDGRKATGYISKYISKNIDAFGVDTDDETDEPADTMAERVIAWARIHAIRQFQTFGLPPIGIYRELRKIRKEQSGALEYYERVRAAADASNYAEVITECWSNDFKLEKKRLFDKDTGEIFSDCPSDVVNRWGDLKEFAHVEGVSVDVLNVETLITRTTEWILQRKEEPGVKEARAEEYDRAIHENQKRQQERRLKLGLPPTNPQDF